MEEYILHIYSWHNYVLYFIATTYYKKYMSVYVTCVYLFFFYFRLLEQRMCWGWPIFGSSHLHKCGAGVGGASKFKTLNYEKSSHTASKRSKCKLWCRGDDDSVATRFTDVRLYKMVLRVCVCRHLAFEETARIYQSLMLCLH